jgi:hypothetical protein
MTQAWYIDAWSVIDGYAFASARSPDSLDATATFVLSPPYFEPEPVASLATALAATRGHFQEGYRLNGEEVRFDAPEQVVELVRRAYRAGGLDMDGTPPPNAPQPRPVRPGDIHPESLIDGAIEAFWNDLLPWLRGNEPPSWPRHYLETSLARLVAATFPQLMPKFFGSAALEIAQGFADDDVDRGHVAQKLGAWIERADALGIYVGFHGAEVVAAPRGSDAGFAWQTSDLPDLTPDLVDSLHPLPYRARGATLSEFELPFAVPVPFVFQNDAADFHSLTTLGHLLAVVSSDPWYLSKAHSPLTMVPVIAAALIQLPTRALPHPGFPPVAGSREMGKLSEVTAHWLARNLPSNRLRGHPAEETIHRLVIHLLTRNNDLRNEPPAAASH